MHVEVFLQYDYKSGLIISHSGFILRIPKTTMGLLALYRRIQEQYPYHHIIWCPILAAVVEAKIDANKAGGLKDLLVRG
jgi:hypothetical protein